MQKLKNLSLLPLLAALLAGCGAGRPAAGGGVKDLFHSPMGRIVASVVAAKERIPGRKIVVYELSDISGRSIPEGKLVAERLTTRLARTGEFQVIERSRLEAAMKELDLSASGVIDAGSAARAGRVLGAEAVLTGTLTRVNGKFEVNARAIEVQTGAIIAAAVEQVDEEDLRVAEAQPRRTAPREPPAQGQEPQFQAPRPVYQLPAARPAAPQPKPGPARGLPAGWEEWPGWDGRYGGYGFTAAGLTYTLSPRQHDALDKPRADGYYPGLLLAREISGKNWTLDMKARYEMSSTGGNWLSLFVWFGKPRVRPSTMSTDMAFAIFAARQADRGYGSDNYVMNCLPKNDMPRFLPGGTSFLRIRREGARFTAYTSTDGKNYAEVFSVRSPEAAAAPVQKIVLGGQAFTSTGSYSEYEYIKLNGAPLF